MNAKVQPIPMIGVATFLLVVSLVMLPARAHASEESGDGAGGCTVEVAMSQDAFEVERPMLPAESAETFGDVDDIEAVDGEGGDTIAQKPASVSDVVADASSHESSSEDESIEQGAAAHVTDDADGDDYAAFPDDAPADEEWPIDLDASVGSVDMYRLYNPNSGEHFYTGNRDECKHLIDVGWRFEGIGWVAPSLSGTPVYRLYSGTDHHYTTSVEEVDYLLSEGWRSEGIGFYSDDVRTVALYRQYNPNVDPSSRNNNSGSHNFTMSMDENDHLVSEGWIAEGIGFFAIGVGRWTDEFRYVFYLDAGHGWGSSYVGQYDPGAGGNGYLEAEQTAELASLVASYAWSLYGINVYTNAYASPSAGVRFTERQRDAASRGCTSLVSIHFNSYNGNAFGTESYIHSVNAAPRSAELQSIMHSHLVGALGLFDRGMKQDMLAVVSGKATNLPSVLLEICFIDNRNDMNVYKAREDAVARALAAGLNEAARRGF